MSINRIRSPYLREIAQGRIDSGVAPDRAVSETLGIALVGKLSNPKISLTGVELPESRHIHVGAPGTAMPGDVSPELLEGIMRRFSNEGELIVHLFSSSSTSLFLGEALNRRVIACDEYGCDVGGGCAGGLFDAYFIESTIKQHKADLLFVQLPQPGVFDRRAFMYPDGDNPEFDHIHWESLAREEYEAALFLLFAAWDPFIKEEGYLIVQMGWCRWDGDYALPWKAVDEIAFQLGWRCTDYHEVSIARGKCASTHPALSTANLLIFTRISP
jgi:hypothetical protein